MGALESLYYVVGKTPHKVMLRMICRNHIRNMVFWTRNDALLGIQKRYEPEKCYYFIISVLWSDRSEIIIYRTLRQIKQLIQLVNQMVPDEANDFQKESNFILKKSNYLNLETGISWHLKCCASITNFFITVVDLRTVLLNHDLLKHLKPRLVLYI